ncbi:MAG: polysaccharide deacetylase family protein [Planctomycetes bacterium]|nr:polysaccharide deacetylase family protein [Planctomycetota bacterium]
MIASTRQTSLSGKRSRGRWKQRLAARLAAPLSACFGPRVANAFGILMYHRVALETPGVPRPTWNVTPERFRQQLAGLLARGYEPWPLRRALEHHRKSLPIARKAFVVTFDDGYENVFTHAWPVLQALSVPATVFVSTAYLDDERPFPFDDWSAAGSRFVPRSAWRPLSTAQCRQMLEGGLIELGTHTHTHRDFRGRPEELAADLRTSLMVLKSRFGLNDATFAFPYGTRDLGYSGPVLSAAAGRAGCLCSLTTEDELVTPNIDPFDWGRFTAEDSDTPWTLAAKLDGWFSAARRMWRAATGRRSTSLPLVRVRAETRDFATNSSKRDACST